MTETISATTGGSGSGGVRDGGASNIIVPTSLLLCVFSLFLGSQ